MSCHLLEFLNKSQVKPRCVNTTNHLSNQDKNINNGIKHIFILKEKKWTKVKKESKYFITLNKNVQRQKVTRLHKVFVNAVCPYEMRTFEICHVFCDNSCLFFHEKFLIPVQCCFSEPTIFAHSQYHHLQLIL